MKAKIVFDSEGWKALKVLQTNHLTVTKSDNSDVKKEMERSGRREGALQREAGVKDIKWLDRSFAPNYNVNN